MRRGEVAQRRYQALNTIAGTCDLERLGRERGGLLEAALVERDIGEAAVERVDEERDVAGLPSQRRQPLVQPSRSLVVTPDMGDPPEDMKGQGAYARVVGLVGEREQLAAVGLGLLEPRQPRA